MTLTEDRDNCGSCGNECKTDRVCEGGSCVCPDGNIACAGHCIDPLIDPQNCGTCGLLCGPLDTCQSGSCLHRPGPSSDQCGGAARNISLRAITASQAVEVPVFDIGDRTPARNAPLTIGRPLLLRGFVDTEPAFSARTLAARLFLSSKSGESVLYDKRTIAADSSALSLDSTFNFHVAEQELSEDTKISIEIVECQPDSASGPVLSPRAPESGTIGLDLSPSPSISIGIVPVDHQGRLPDTSEANLALYSGALRAMFPLSTVELTVLEPMPSEQEGELNFDLLLARLQDRRLSDRAGPELYYFGFVQPKETLREHCMSGDCTYGIAYQSRTAAFHVALGIEYADQISRDTFVHEIGHNMALGHAPCGTDGDPNYPYAGALLGSIGFDFRNQTLLDPSTTKDIMSYCDPAWASDYTYRTVFAALTSSITVGARRFPDSDPARDFLSILVKNGFARLGPHLASLAQPEESPESAVILNASGSELLETEAYRIQTGDSSLLTWLIPMPDPGAATVVLPDGTRLTLAEGP